MAHQKRSRQTFEMSGVTFLLYVNSCSTLKRKNKKVGAALSCSYLLRVVEDLCSRASKGLLYQHKK